MEKIISEKYGVQSEEQAKALSEILINNAVEQLVTAEYIFAENHLDIKIIQERFKYLLLEKSVNLLDEIFRESLKKLTENTDEGE